MDRRLFLHGILTLPLLSGTARAAVATPKKKPPTSLPLLVLDPGHGGRDPGAISKTGMYEKEIVLDIAHRLAGEVQGFAQVKLTREDDRFLALDERVEIARANEANLFISLHADSAPTPGARGLSAYTLSESASDSFTAQLAENENIVDQRYGAKLRQSNAAVADILFDLTAQRTVGAARLAKSSLIAGLGEDLRLLEHPSRAANFAVLRAPDVPSLLIETGFLSNPHDAEALAEPPSRATIARALGREIGKLLKDPLFS